MTAHDPIRFRYRSISQHQGYMELTPGIHPGCVNVEAWEFGADVDLSGAAWVVELDDHVPLNGNPEIELTANEARRLAETLNSAGGAETMEADGPPLLIQLCMAIEYRRGVVQVTSGVQAGGVHLQIREIEGWLTKVELHQESPEHEPEIRHSGLTIKFELTADETCELAETLIASAALVDGD